MQIKKKPKVDKKEAQIVILSKGVYKIFDRTPVGSLRSKAVSDLLDEILK